MLNTIWIVFRYEVLQQGRRRGYLIFTFGIPILALVGYFGYQAYTSIESNDQSDGAPDLLFEDVGQVGYVDESGIFVEPTAPPFAGKLILYDDESSAKKDLEADRIEAFYVVPADYLKTGDVERVVESFNLNEDDRDLFEAFVLNRLLTDASTAQLYIRLQDPLHLTVNQVSDSGDIEARDEDADFVLVYVFAMIFILTVFTVNRYLMQSVVEEHETMMIEIIISSIRPAPLLIGKILAMGLLGLIQMSMMIGTGAYILVQLSASEDALGTIDVPITSLALMLTYFIGGYLFLGSLFAGVGAISNSMREGPQIATIFSLPAVAPLWVTFIFATDPNGTVPVVMSLFPLTAPLAMIMRVSIVTVPAWQLALSLVLLAISVGGAMWFAGRLFRVRTLLSGTRPRLRDLPRLLLTES